MMPAEFRAPGVEQRAGWASRRRPRSRRAPLRHGCASPRRHPGRRAWGVGCRGLFATCLLLAAGCLGPHKELKYLGESDLEYYKAAATSIAWPDVPPEMPEEVLLSAPPRGIDDFHRAEIRDLELAEAIHLALQNNPVLRERAQFLSPQNQLLTNPMLANNSVFDPAIAESEILGGQGVGGTGARRGVEDALAEFDAAFTTQMLWRRDERVANNAFESGGLAPGDTLVEETAAFQAGLEKQFAYGGRFSVNQNWDYSLSNTPGRLFGSLYTGSTVVRYTRPLWAGSGAEFTRIAGPVAPFGQNPRSVQPVDRGVVIARIGTDITLADFEANVRGMLRDVEDLYWELALTYRTYHAEAVALASALETWRKVEAQIGRPGFGAANEAQARDNYYEAKNRAQQALADLYRAEGELRRLLGLPVNDRTVLRPVTDPILAELEPDWHLSLTEALTHRLELRRQKWWIKSLSLQLEAARSLTRPRLDFVSDYRVNAFGDRLFGQGDDDRAGTSQGLRSAMESLTQGNQTGWTLGLQMELPLGFRSARAQVRNLELRLAKARAVLAAQEHEISHELAHAFRELDRWYETARTNFNRRRAAEARVRVFETLVDNPPPGQQPPIDPLLRAQFSLAQAETAYYQSVINYQRAIVELYYRKGMLLEKNNVRLAEGLWHPEAYEEALRRAWARSHAFEVEKLHSEPGPFAIEVPPLLKPVFPPGPAEERPPESEEGQPEKDEPGPAKEEDGPPPLPAPPPEPSPLEQTAAAVRPFGSDLYGPPPAESPSAQPSAADEPAWRPTAGD